MRKLPDAIAKEPYAYWLPEREMLCHDLIAKGLSASQIAAKLGGGTTRNAVCGKAKRMGWRLGRLRLPRGTGGPNNV